MQKRDPIRKEYLPYHIPSNWHCPLTTQDMTEDVNCTNCGKDMKFGDCYTSKQIHTNMGFGYPVCEECYEKEKK